MRVMIVGSGGREHTIAWKIVQSPLLSKLFICPGNPGTRLLGENVSLSSNAEIVKFAAANHVDLVIVGPEIPLAEGLADLLRAENIKVFGPSQKGAQIESSKTFSKEFMQRHNIPTARFMSFNDHQSALEALDSFDCPIVIKASGLAAGKGVILPESPEEARQTLHEIMLEKKFGDAGAEVIIEERLVGEEVSLLAFTDGKTVVSMPPAQDHKRLLDEDKGPNTGGMGTYAPAPICSPEDAAEYTRMVLQPAVDGLRAEGISYCGVLYAGLILTQNGPKVLEFNCRFGDPETQVILPLLESDLLEIACACAEGELNQVDIEWKDNAAACVVLASENYPESSSKGNPISGLEKQFENAFVFQAGTALRDDVVINSGGRVLGVTGFGAELRESIHNAYQAVDEISFDGMQYRRDIGGKGLKYMKNNTESAYAKAGVDINAGQQAVDLMSKAVKSTYNEAVLAGIGSFGGLFDASVLKNLEEPVLVASSDGVGTKVKLAAKTKKYESIGMDIVNHCIDDILVQGAVPLFFLDYIASSKLEPKMVAEAVSGIAAACRESGCVLLGGETAEMPGVYAPNEFDLAGTIIGVVERSKILPRGDIKAGDVLIGLRSTGPHTNGYSLLRSLFEDLPADAAYPELAEPLFDALLKPHRSYLPLLKPLLESEESCIKALAHLTGGGFYENIPRVLPKNLDARIRSGSWPVLPIFELARKLGNISFEEMHRVFNMGIGMIVVLDAADVAAFQTAIPEETWVIGELVEGSGEVVIQ